MVERPCLRLVTALLVATSTATLVPARLGPRAQEPVQVEAPSPRVDRHDRERLEKRWRQKSEEERALLRRRFEEWRRLTPEQRAKLAERARSLRVVEEDLREDPPVELREELAGLGPEGRAERWRRSAQERFRQRGRSLRDRLPPPFLRRLEAAPPEERDELLHRFRLEQVERKGHMMFGYLAREMELTSEQVDGFQRLPFAEKMATLRRLRREYMERMLESGEQPAGLSPQTWERLRGLSDREFFERLWGHDFPRLHGLGRRGARDHPPGPPELRSPDTPPPPGGRRGPRPLGPDGHKPAGRPPHRRPGGGGSQSVL